MQSTNRDNTVRAYGARVIAATEQSTEAVEPRRLTLTAVKDAAAPAPPVTGKSPERSNRIFHWLVGVALLILIAVLAAVMVNAGINVEVLP